MQQLWVCAIIAMIHAEVDKQEKISVDNLNDIVSSFSKNDTKAPAVLPPGRTFGTQQYMHTLSKKVTVSELRNRELRVVVPAIEPPYVNYVNFSDSAEKQMGYGPGIVIEIMKDIQKSLNLTYKVLNCSQHLWGSYENGTWTGAFGQLFYGDADILAGGAIMQYDRSLITDLTYPFQYELTGMLIRSPEKYQDDTMLIVTEPFRWEVWVIIVASIVCSGGVLVFLTVTIGHVYHEMSYTLFEGIWVFFSIFVQQGLREQPRSWSCRLLIALWWLSSITLLATFTGSLVALFAVDKMALPFQDIDGLVRLVKQGKYTILMDSNSLTRTEMIAKSQLPVFEELWYEISVNKRVKYIDGIDSAVEFIRNSQGYVFLGPWDTLSYHAYTDCRLILLDQGILPVYLSIPLAKDSMYSTYFSNRIRELVERGFTDKWSSDYRSYIASQKSYKCNATNQESRSYLDLRRAQGAFWVLLGGLGSSLVLLLVEYVYLFFRQKFDCSWIIRKEKEPKENGAAEERSMNDVDSTRTESNLSEFSKNENTTNNSPDGRVSSMSTSKMSENQKSFREILI